MGRRKKASRTSVSAKGRNKRQLLPESIQHFLARRLTDSLAVFYGIFALFILLSMVSYAPLDPSLNAASSETAVSNWLGAPGAYIADFFHQTFGLIGYLPAFILGIWAYRTVRRTDISRLAVRSIGLILMCLGLSTAFALIPSPSIWGSTPHFAGTVGVMCFNALTSLLSGVIGTAAYGLVSALALMIGTLGLIMASGMKIAEWGVIRATVWGGIKAIALRIGYLSSRFKSWHEAYDTQPVRERTAPVIAEKSASKPTATKDTSFMPDTLKSALGSMQIVTPKPSAPAKSANATKQTSLKLDTDWELPQLDLLQETPADQRQNIDEKALQKNAELLHGVLQDFNIEGDIIKVNPGPIVTLYELEPAPGTKSSRVINLSDDIARSMSATSVRVAVIPGKNALGIEMPNVQRETVYMRELLNSRAYDMSKAKLPLILGKDIGGEPVIADLARMPHLLVAGTTGSGKSVSINTMLLSLLYRHSPETCRLIMIDPKMLELSVYDDIPHLLTPVVTEPHKAITSLKWAVREMEDRYRAMSKLGVRNIEGYNKRMKEAQKTGEIIMNKVQTGFDPETGKPVFEEQPMSMTELPYIVIIVDEFADLMLAAGKEVENAIQRLAQMARAAGLHFIMATQRPSVDVITGVIKANFPTRISFSVTSKIDSRTILGDGGAEQLLGMGDMLYMAAGGKLKRVHGPFVDDDEVENVVNFLKEQGEPEYVDSVTDDDGEESSGFAGISSGDREGYDELYDQAVQIVITERKASTSFVQRHLQIGYNRAARIIEQMEKDGLIGPANHVGKRQILLETAE